MPNPPKRQRASLGLDDALVSEETASSQGSIDLSSFQPKKAVASRPSREQLQQTSAAAQFPSREANRVFESAAPSPVVAAPTRIPTVQLNTRIPVDVDEDLTLIVQRTGWKKAEAVKRALTALKRFSDVADAAGLDLEKTLQRAAEAIEATKGR